MNSQERHERVRTLLAEPGLFPYEIDGVRGETALILDAFEKRDERISRIENCLLDPSPALRGPRIDPDFSKPKRNAARE